AVRVRIEGRTAVDRQDPERELYADDQLFDVHRCAPVAVAGAWWVDGKDSASDVAAGHEVNRRGTGTRARRHGELSLIDARFIAPHRAEIVPAVPPPHGSLAMGGDEVHMG